jgi:fucose 4-O-acetylase-like acetyltransferase
MRNLYWDAWKGAAIIAVVAIHALSYSLNAAVVSPLSDMDNLFVVASRQFINFPVPLFFFISGYFAFVPDGQPAKARKVFSRLWRLALPYLIWSLIYTAIRYTLGNYALSDFVLDLATGQTVYVGYFVIVMMQISILSPWLVSGSRKLLITLFGLGLLCSVLFSYWGRYQFDVISEFPGSALPFFLWIHFYIAGIWFKKFPPKKLGQISPAIALLIWAVLIAVSLFEAFHIAQKDFGFSHSQLKLSSMVLSMWICVLAWRWSEVLRSGDSILSWIGRRSYFFYLSHMLALTMVQKVVSHISVVGSAGPMFTVTIVVLTLVACAVFAVVFEALVKSRTIIKNFGMR